MRLHKINYSEIRELISHRIMVFEKRSKYNNYDRDVALLSFFVFGLILFPTLLVLYIFIECILKNTHDALMAFLFLVFLTAADSWLFVFGYNSYLLHKKPLDVFWKHFINRKAKLFLIGPIDIDGREYVLHGFKERGSGALGDTFVITLSVRKDVHDRAMKLIDGGNYRIAVDGSGKEKVVINSGERIEDVDRDTLLVMKFIETLYALYGNDINELWAKKKYLGDKDHGFVLAGDR